MLVGSVLLVNGIASAQDGIIVRRAPAAIVPNTDARPQDPVLPSDPPSSNETITAPPTVSLLLADGSWRVGRLESVDTEEWRVVVRAGGGTETQRIPATEAIAFVVRRSSLRPALGSDAEARNCAEGSLLQIAPLSLGVIHTLDGQCLPGTFRIANGRALWEHRWIGAIPLTLDRIASLRMIADRRAPNSDEADTILLLNGDVVRGFIEEIAEDISLSPLDAVDGPDAAADDASRPGSGSSEAIKDSRESAGDPAERAEKSTEDAADGGKSDPEPPAGSQRLIAMERVAAFALADMPIEPRAGIDVWTADGSIVGAKGLGFVAPIGWSFTLDADWLRAIRSQSTSDNQAADPLAGVLDRDRFLPLAACRVGVASSVTPKGYRYRTDAPARLRDSSRYLLGCTEIEIDGPSSISFEIPERFRASGTILTGLISLAEPCPADARVEVTISFGDSATESFVLDGNRRCQPFTVRSQGSLGAGVTILVGDAGNGVAGDRIVLERAALIAPR